MGYWADVQRKSLSRVGIEVGVRVLEARRCFFRERGTSVPVWLWDDVGLLGVGSAPVDFSPTLARLVHLLAADARGLAVARLPRLLALLPRLHGTRVRGPKARVEELRRVVLWVEASLRTFLAAIYQAEGDSQVVTLLYKLPLLRGSKDLRLSAELLVRLLDFEVRYHSKRDPFAAATFLGVLQSGLQLLGELDFLLTGWRQNQVLEEGVLRASVVRGFSLYAQARQFFEKEETLDEYVLSVVLMMVQPGVDVFPDHELGSVGEV